MDTAYILERLFMSTETEAAARSKEVQPDYIVDVRAEAEAPVSGAEAVHGIQSFSLVNGGPTDPEEVRHAARFIVGRLQEEQRVLLH